MTEILTKYDRLVIKPVVGQDNTVGMIVVPDLDNQKADRYTVVGTGPGTYNPQFDKYIPTQYQVGDEIFVHKVHVHSIVIEGEEFFITRDVEVLGKIIHTPDATN